MSEHTDQSDTGGGMPTRLSPKVYRRRRIAVVVGLLAAIAIIVMLVVGPQGVAGWFGGGEKPAQADSQGTEQGDEAKPNDDKQSPKGAASCDMKQVSVEAITDQSSYDSGESPQFSLRVTNHNDVPCDLDLGTKTMGFVVTSGGETYWDSRHCQTNPETTLVRMEPDQSLETEALPWNRTRSTPETCDSERPVAPGGGASYHLTAEIAGVESPESAQFLMY